MRKYNKNELIVLYIMLKFKDKEMGILPLTKLLYDCELYSVDNNGKRLTNYDIKHYKHGPFIDLYNTVKIFSTFKENSNGEMDTSIYHIKDEYINNKEIDFSPIGKDKELLDSILDEWHKKCSFKKFSGKVLKELINHTYMTEPLFDTKFDDKIDLLKYGKGSRISDVLITSDEYKKISNNVKKYSNVYEDFLKGLPN